LILQAFAAFSLIFALADESPEDYACAKLELSLLITALEFIAPVFFDWGCQRPATDC